MKRPLFCFLLFFIFIDFKFFSSWENGILGKEKKKKTNFRKKFWYRLYLSNHSNHVQRMQSLGHVLNLKKMISSPYFLKDLRHSFLPTKQCYLLLYNARKHAKKKERYEMSQISLNNEFNWTVVDKRFSQEHFGRMDGTSQLWMIRMQVKGRTKEKI